MAISEGIIENPADKISKSLKELNDKKSQIKSDVEKKIQQRDEESALLDVLKRHDEDIKNSQNTIEINSHRLGILKKLISVQKEKTDERFQELIKQIEEFDKKNLKNIDLVESSLIDRSNSLSKEIVILKRFIDTFKIDYKDLLNKPVLVSVKDIDERIANLKVNYNDLFNKPDLLQKEDIDSALKKLKIDYQELLNKPKLLIEEDIKKLIVEYFKKAEGLLNVNSELSDKKIKEIKQDYSELDNSFNQLTKALEDLKKEDKRIREELKKVNTYSGGSQGFEYFPSMSKVAVITSNYPASSVDFIILANATAGNITVTLPPATKTGLIIAIKKIDSSTNTVTIQRGVSDTIEGSTSITLSDQYTGRWLVAGGASIWYVVASTGTLTGDLIGTDFVRTRSGTITRDGNDYISVITKTGGRTITITRDVNNYITSITDGTRTWTYTRNASNQVTSWSVA